MSNKNCHVYFLSNYWKFWATFYFSIWSLWPRAKESNGTVEAKMAWKCLLKQTLLSQTKESKVKVLQWRLVAWSSLVEIDMKAPISRSGKLLCSWQTPKKSLAHEWQLVWPEKNRQMSIKLDQNWFYEKKDRFWHLSKNSLRMWEIWAN